MPDNGKKAEDRQDTFDREYVEGLRGESASYRTKLRETESAVEELQQRLKSYEDANKSDVEKLTAEKAALEAERDLMKARAEREAIDANIAIACAKANVRDAEAVKALLDRSEITYEGGVVRGVEKAVKALLKEKDYLISSEEAPPKLGASGGKSLTEGEEGGIDNVFLKMLKGI